MNSPGIKQKVGCWLNERWRLEMVLRWPKLAGHLGIGPWQRLRNRHEVIEVQQDAVSCEWRDSSMLTVAKMFPDCGARLCRGAAAEWPFSHAASDVSDKLPIAVIIPVSGAGRWDRLQYVIAHVVSQKGGAAEVIVVEHSPTSELGELLPDGVRYCHEQRTVGEPFNKSLAMNRGAAQAKSPVLAFLDGDCVISQRQLADVTEKLDAGGIWEAVRPIRFLFLLGEADTRRLVSGSSVESISDVREVQQNFPGLFTCVRRDVYWEIGGHDERFEGWGGEDNEFLERLNTRAVYPGAYAPAIHLWHEPAPKKASGDRNMDLYREIIRVPVQTRIEELRAQFSSRGCPEAGQSSDSIRHHSGVQPDSIS